MIYTSYFGNIKNIPKNYILVSIARYTPKWFTGITYPKLFPSKNLLQKWKNQVISIEEYSKEYIADNLHDKEQTQKDLNLIGANIVLLCYERPEDFCHRQLVADWLDITEYPIYKKK